MDARMEAHDSRGLLGYWDWRSNYTWKKQDTQNWICHLSTSYWRTSVLCINPVQWLPLLPLTHLRQTSRFSKKVITCLGWFNSGNCHNLLPQKTRGHVQKLIAFGPGGSRGSKEGSGVWRLTVQHGAGQQAWMNTLWSVGSVMTCKYMVQATKWEDKYPAFD